MSIIHTLKMGVKHAVGSTDKLQLSIDRHISNWKQSQSIN